eukprot:CAMPEP_0116846524 /NCGR_PEP_ID=MMETSP0418-20121206/13882_1 /TAXON_ID=1158023 /ORGANISM="Astrosyne radiata, Strain 13vi08-1A" /LENGTH=232 /DNA_ID=CAMNT_0004477779 /DNA_START=121 /DNA_END=819 /DNA_ORIENTATION=+
MKPSATDTGSLDDAPVTFNRDFSDVINEDFLVVEGLEIEESLLDLSLNASSVFDTHIDENSAEENDTDIEPEPLEVSALSSSDVLSETSETSRSEAPTRALESPGKRSKADRSRSPVAKRLRSLPSDQDAVPPEPPAPQVPAKNQEIVQLEQQYKMAMQQLALSMKRSELTRNEIIRQRQFAAANQRLAQEQAKNLSKASSFLTGGQSTLTLGLEQSRRMLHSYMGLNDKMI